MTKKNKIMKAIQIFVISLVLTLSCKAQEKINYHIYGNIGLPPVTYNDEDYLQLKPVVLEKYKSLEGSWKAQEDDKLIFDVQVFERSLKGGSFYSDKCLGYNHIHIDFMEKFILRIGGTGYDDINKLNKIYFRIRPETFSSGKIGVSGFIYIVDDNTFRMEVMGVWDPGEEGDEIRTRPDFKFETAPADLLGRVPKILRKKILIFKRQ